MNRRQKIIRSIVAVIGCTFCYILWSLITTLYRLPEAYAAWDVGTLLVTYLAENKDEWPTGWDDLARTFDVQNKCPKMRGSEGMPSEIINELKSFVKIDFSCKPQAGVMAYPITNSRGLRFRTIWEGAEPNKMVYRWITNRY